MWLYQNDIKKVLVIEVYKWIRLSYLAAVRTILLSPY